ncbi:MAG: hypothetical protein ACRDRU_21655 [Pseudonocardiaceae bacterium]
MAALPLRDHVGNTLVDFRFADESKLEIVDNRITMPLLLIVVTLADTVLMVPNGSADSGSFPVECVSGVRPLGRPLRES